MECLSISPKPKEVDLKLLESLFTTLQVEEEFVLPKANEVRQQIIDLVIETGINVNQFLYAKQFVKVSLKWIDIYPNYSAN